MWRWTALDWGRIEYIWFKFKFKSRLESRKYKMTRTKVEWSPESRWIKAETGLKVFMKIDLIKRLKTSKDWSKENTFEKMTSGTRGGHLPLDKRKTFILDKRSFISVPAEVIYPWTSGRHSFWTRSHLFQYPRRSFAFGQAEDTHSWQKRSLFQYPQDHLPLRSGSHSSLIRSHLFWYPWGPFNIWQAKVMHSRTKGHQPRQQMSNFLETKTSFT